MNIDIRNRLAALGRPSVAADDARDDGFVRGASRAERKRSTAEFIAIARAGRTRGNALDVFYSTRRGR